MKISVVGYAYRKFTHESHPKGSALKSTHRNFAILKCSLIRLIYFSAALLQAGSILGTNEATEKVPPPSNITAIHIKARSSPYPGSIVQRARVPDSFIPWEVSFIHLTNIS